MQKIVNDSDTEKLGNLLMKLWAGVSDLNLKEIQNKETFAE